MTWLAKAITVQQSEVCSPSDWDGGGIEIRRDFELVPEPDNRYDPWAISVRADNRTIGYIQRADAPRWANVVRGISASGHIPVAPGRVYAFERPDWESWNGTGDPPKDFGATVQLKLGDPSTALPLNNPPGIPHTLLSRDETFGAMAFFIPEIATA
jgi:hypothetical protein